MKAIYCLLPRFFSKIGHIYHYHLSTQKALENIGWKYFAFYPKRAEVTSLPPNWIPCLANDLSPHPKGFFAKLRIFSTNIAPLRKIFRHIEKKAEAILFIEHFEIPHLCSMVVALFFLKPLFQFWILHRYSIDLNSSKAHIYRFLHAYLEKKIGRNNIRYLTDSELLAEVNQNALERRFHVAPIPHTESRDPSLKDHSFPVTFWWPGGLIREDKGFAVIRNLAQLLKARSKIRLVLAENAQPFLSKTEQITFIPPIVSREEYLEWMQQSDLVLLPYSATDYAFRTSGIFVEAICMGAIPVTTQGTWMAYELKKFGLLELTFTWKEENLLARLLALFKNQRIANALEPMRAHYRSFHSEKGFAAFCQQLTIKNS